MSKESLLSALMLVEGFSLYIWILLQELLTSKDNYTLPLQISKNTVIVPPLQTNTYKQGTHIVQINTYKQDGALTKLSGLVAKPRESVC